MYDCLIIGGGASGLCAAIRLKQNNPNLKVIILEKLSRVGKKLSITGNGRCNISNSEISIERFHGEDTFFAEYCLSKYCNAPMIDFFDNIGVPFINEGKKLYPACLQASSVVDALRFECDKLGIETLLEATVSDIKIDNGYTVISNKGSFRCKNVIIASGLLSGGDKLGCDGGILKLLLKKGYSAVDISPAIVQLKTETDIVKQLKGIKVNALATLKIDNKPTRSELDEVLFCDYGLSGPAIMQISREASRVKTLTATVCLDLLPDISFSDLVLTLKTRKHRLSSRLADEFFTGMLNKRLGQVILKISGFKMNERVADFDEKRLKATAKNLKSFEFRVIGNTGFINSQVSAGGLAVNQFFNTSMMSKKHKGLFAIGEILDIDGDCGGFNLSWAFASAMCAADFISEDIK